MITARFGYSDGVLQSFVIRGHSGSAQAGEDIVCSAVSSAAYMAANTITEVMRLHPDISEKDGFLSLALHGGESGEAAQLLEGLRLHLQGLAEQYPKYIQVERGADNA